MCSKYKHVYKQAKSRIEEDIDIVKLVLKVREHSVILENSLLKNERRKTYVQHTYHNVINVENSDLESDGSSSDKFIDSN
jgi:hypothetical protein